MSVCIFVFQKVLSDFVNIELHFHAKALELYTNCFKGLANINEDEDLEVWCWFKLI